MDPGLVMDDNGDTVHPNRDATDGDPVVLPTGNFSIKKTDLRIRGRGMDFEFTRTYRSGSAIHSPLGVGWDHNWNQQIVLAIDTSGAIEGAYYFNGQLRVDRFDIQGTSSLWGSPPGYFAKLRHEGAADFITTLPTEFHLRSKDGRILTFRNYLDDIADPYYTHGGRGAIYRLTRLEDRMGNFITLHYEFRSHGYRRLDYVEDTYGRTINFEYDVGGDDEALDYIEDHDGRRVTFDIDGTLGNLLEVTSPEVHTDPVGTGYDQGKAVQYLYQDPDPHNLTGIRDAQEHQLGAGSGPNYVTNTYMGDRVVRQVYGGTNASGIPAGGTFSFVYESERVPIDRVSFFEASRTLVVDPNGNVALHLFDPEGNERVCWEFTGRLDPDAVNDSFRIYDDLVNVTPAAPVGTDSLNTNAPGHVAALRSTGMDIDPNSFVTTKVFNSNGVLTSLQEPGYKTEYTYDELSPDAFQQGNLLKISKEPVPDNGEAALVELYAYEPFYNQVRTYVDPRGHATHTWFDYQECTEDTAFAGEWGIEVDQGSQELFLGTQGLTVGRLDFTQADLNGDGTCTNFVGNPVRIEAPPTMVFDDPVSGSKVPQVVVTTTVFNNLSLPMTATDPKGNVTSFEYYPSDDPSGDDPGSTGSGTGGGFLRRMVDLELVEQLFEYDIYGRVTRSVDGRGFDATTLYNELDQIVEQSNPLGYDTRYVYDWNDNLIEVHVEDLLPTIVDGLPTGAEQQGGSGGFIVHRYKYDILDNLIEEDLQADGSTRLVTQYRYDKNSNRVLTLYPESVAGNDSSNVMSIICDERDLVYETTRGGATAAFGNIRAHGDLVPPSSTDPSTTHKAYDQGQQLVSLIDADGHRHTWEYDPFERLDASRAPSPSLDIWTDYEYDPSSNVTSIKSYDKSPSGNNRKLEETTYEYDELNRLRETNEWLEAGTLGMTILDGPLSPGNQMVTTRHVFDENSLTTRIVDDNTVSTHFTYDQRNRLKTVADDQGNTVTYSYDEADNVIHTQEVEVGVASSTFNNWNFYDKLGRMHATVNDIGHVYRSVYDSRNNLRHYSDACADGTGGYDPVSSLDLYGEHSGLPLLHIPASGNGTEYTYDDYNRQLSTIKYMRVGGAGGQPIDPVAAVDGRITMEQEYDLNSRLKLQRDDPKASGASGATTYGYDSLNRLTTITCADDEPETRTYFQRDLVHTRTDPNGTTVTNAYDALGRIVTRSVAKGPGIEGTSGELYIWDGLSRLKRAVDDDTQVTRRYDTLSRVIRERINGVKTDTVYDGVGLLRSQVYPGLRNIVRQYDSINRLDDVRDSGAQDAIASYTYEGPRRVKTRSMLNGTDLTIGYDGIRRTTSLLHTSTAGTVDHRAFGWDGANNKEIRLNYQTGVLHRYGYDSAYRMVKSTRSKPGEPDEVIDYTLDGVGNRELVAGGNDPGQYQMSPGSPLYDEVMNQYTQAPGVPVPGQDPTYDDRTHDKNGNLTSISGPLPERNATLVYDYRNQLIRYEDVNANQEHHYGYDALGRRFVKTVDAGGVQEESTHYFYDGWQVVEEQDLSGVTQATYVYGNDLDGVLTMKRSGVEYYYHQDDLGNVNKLTNSQGTVVESFEYSDYGLVLDATTFTPIPDPVTRTTPHAAVGNPYYFTGARLDEETGLYYMRHRYMEPWTGRFVSRDPLGVWGDAANCGNAQAYAGSNPWTLTDPLGLATASRGYSPQEIMGMWQTENQMVAQIHGLGVSIKHLRGLGGISLVMFTSTDVQSTFVGVVEDEPDCKEAGPTVCSHCNGRGGTCCLTTEEQEENGQWDLGIGGAGGFAYPAFVRRFYLPYDFIGPLQPNQKRRARGTDDMTDEELEEYLREYTLAVAGSLGGGGGGAAKAGVKKCSAKLGRALSKEFERQAGMHAHHIVAAAKKAAEAQAVLVKYKVGINDAVNGVFVKAKTHMAMHTEDYYEVVNETLSAVKSRPQVIRALGKLRDMIQKGIL
jgi:RHS repeat-associated protein